MGRLENIARERVVRWRKQHGVSQERLAALAKIHQTTVGKWERGDVSVDIDTLSTWARHFGKSLFDLVAHDDLSESPDANFVAAYNAADDGVKAAIVALLASLPKRTNAPTPAPKSAGKRGKHSAS